MKWMSYHRQTFPHNRMDTNLYIGFISSSSYDTIYGTWEARNQLSYLCYKLETVDEDTDEDEITCKVIQVIRELGGNKSC